MPAYRMRKRARQQNEKSRHQRNNLRLSRLSQKIKEASGSGRSGRSQWEVPHRDQSMGLKEMLVGLRLVVGSQIRFQVQGLKREQRLSSLHIVVCVC